MAEYASNCELVLALVSPIGVNLDDVENRLISIFKQFRYQVNFIQLSKAAKEYSEDLPMEEGSELERLDNAMKIGTNLRLKFRRGDFYALVAVEEINKKRNEGTNPLGRYVHVIRSLKHPDEVETLRQIYGCGFFLLGISASIESRKHYLKELKGIPNDELDRLIQRDDKEKLDHEFGQQTAKVFQMADAFVNTDDCERLSVQLGRIVDLLFSKPVVPPTIEEYAMFMAYAASLRSAGLSRQVGAVITNAYSDIVSTGANDVPKFGGGLYWPGDDDNRDYIKGYDSNQREKSNIIQNVIDCLGEDIQNPISARKKLEASRITDLTEFGRAVHAEMEALMCSGQVNLATI
jgi:deoxycytidylate deaminase